MKENGFDFDIAFTSVLSRAMHTYDLTAEQMKYAHLPVIRSWRLNERHYGALQGFNKAETAEEFGYHKVKLWRRSYSIQPPALNIHDKR